MKLFEGIKETGCYTAWVDFCRGEFGMKPSELGGEEDVSQLKLAISCPGWITGHIGQALLWQERSRPRGEHVDVTANVYDPDV